MKRRRCAIGTATCQPVAGNNPRRMWRARPRQVRARGGFACRDSDYGMQTSTLAPAASVAVPSSSGDCSQLPEGALVANGPCSTTFSKCNYGQAPDNATTSRMSPDVRATSRRRNVSEGGLLGLWTSTGSFNGIFADRSSYVAAGMNQSAITATSSSTATPVTAADVPTSPVVATGSCP
jgi:hypothetical protein